MASATTIKSIEDTFGRMKKLITPNTEAKALVRAGFFIQRQSQLLTPVDTGNLRASARTFIVTYNRPVKVRVSYSAEYAVRVHEAPPSVNFIVGENRFLQKAVDRNLQNIRSIVGTTLRQETGINENG